MLLSGKVAIVTGASRGIGRACAERFASEGAKVVLADVSDQDGNSLATELANAGHAAKYVHANVTERLDVHNLITEAIEAYGRLDVMVTCAGIIETAPFLEMEEAAFDQTLNVNLKGTFLCAQAAARQMVRQLETAPNEKPGAIVTLSSVNAWFGLPDSAAYSASKGGVSQLTKSISIALAQHGIRVNAIGPGTIETSINADRLAVPEHLAERLSRTPLGRMGQPSEIAAVAVWLASDQASYITGQTIYADGGRLPLNLTMPQLDK